ncbi:hypothetical protein [Qaidamihabitans albus]|uniref:hypothetical protein n=1 Tax=Qaidamihabitans albus TaxID=2795733 RepID=UPI001F1B11A7|nr:hypothetical protein [Qaidamihabitans albus]
MVAAALRPDTAPLDRNPRRRAVGVAVERLGGALLGLIRELEPEQRYVSADNAIARAAHLAAHISLSDRPNREPIAVADPAEDTSKIEFVR